MSYSPTLGRWIEADPIGYVDGPNLYEFVRDNPVDETDPTGEQTQGPTIDPNAKIGISRVSFNDSLPTVVLDTKWSVSNISGSGQLIQHVHMEWWYVDLNSLLRYSDTEDYYEGWNVNAQVDPSGHVVGGRVVGVTYDDNGASNGTQADDLFKFTIPCNTMGEVDIKGLGADFYLNGSNVTHAIPPDGAKIKQYPAGGLPAQGNAPPGFVGAQGKPHELHISWINDAGGFIPTEIEVDP